MRFKIILIFVFGIFSMILAQTKIPGIVIPHLKSFSDKALKVDLLADIFGNVANPKDVSAQAKLFWNENSLFVSISISDDTITASDNAELFIADTRGGKNMMQFFFSDFDKKVVKCTLWDFRSSRKLTEILVKYTFSFEKTKNKIVINFELPLNQLGKKQIMNAELGINMMISDIDNDRSANNQSLKWSYSNGTDKNSYATIPVKLGKEKVKNVKSSLKVFWENDTTVVFKYISQKNTSLSFKDFYSQKEISSIKIEENKQGFNQSLINTYQSNQINSKISVFQEEQKLNDIDLVFAPKNEKNINMDNLREEIDRFQFLDLNRKNKPEVLFVGHSMFRYWFTMEDDFKEYNILNRGFGGSRLENILANYHKIILPYQPKTIVLINGCNDLTFGDSPELAFSEFKSLVEKIHNDLPYTKLIVLTHPSFYYGYFKNLKQYDDLMITYIQSSGWIQLADIREALPTTIPDLHSCLLPDYTHLNAKGYKLLIPIISKQLKIK